MRSYSITFYTPGSQNERDHTYLLVAGRDLGTQKMAVSVLAFTAGTPEPRRKLIFAVAQDEEGAIKEAAQELRGLPDNQDREEMFYPLDQSEVVQVFQRFAP